jgi:peptidyl-prolyl cis-trans isomerase C
MKGAHDMIRNIVLFMAAVALIFSFACAKKVAEGDGWSITAKEFREKYDSLPPDATPFTASSEGKKRYLDSLILREIIYHEAEKEGITKDPIIVNRIEDARKKVVIEEYLKRKIEGGLSPTQKEKDAYYEEHKDAFDNAESIRVRHILVKTEDEIKKIQKLLADGEDFGKLARENSICPTASEGGDLGYFKRGDMVEEFDRAAFALKKPGDISPIVKTQFGYHLIELVDKDHLMEKFISEKRDDLINRYLEDLKGKADYKTFEENLSFDK